MTKAQLKEELEALHKRLRLLQVELEYWGCTASSAYAARASERAKQAAEYMEPPE